MSLLDIKKPPAIKQARIVCLPAGSARRKLTDEERALLQRQRNVEYGRRRRAEGRGTSGT